MGSKAEHGGEEVVVEEEVHEQEEEEKRAPTTTTSPRKIGPRVAAFLSPLARLKELVLGV